MSSAVFPRYLIVAILLGCVALAACTPTEQQESEQEIQSETVVPNPVLHFEIPVNNMDRAVAFYEHVFGLKLRRQQVDGYDMAFFPGNSISPGASGALASGEVYRPSKEGTVVYFDVPDIDAVLARAKARGASVLYPKKDIGEAGFVAEFEDTEGNRIALSQIANPE